MTTATVIEEIEAAITQLTPSELAEFTEWFNNFTSNQRKLHDELDIINRHADELNKEATDVLDYQALP